MLPAIKERETTAVDENYHLINGREAEHRVKTILSLCIKYDTNIR